MKLWEILKEENVGTIYIDDENNKYELKLVDNEPRLFDYMSGMSCFSQRDIMSLNFEDIKMSNDWKRKIDGEIYYFISTRGKIRSYNENSDDADDELFESYNYFSTREKATEVRDMNLLQRKMLKFYDENDGKVDWNNKSQQKYSIYCYCGDYESWEISWTYKKKYTNEVYFSSEELAQRCIDKVIKPFMEEQ